MSLSDFDQDLLSKAQFQLDKQLLNRDLQRICREEGLPISGIKAQLQTRVSSRIKHLLEQGEIDAFRQLCKRIVPPQPAYAYSSPSGNNFVGHASERFQSNGYKGNGATYPSPSDYPASTGSVAYSKSTGNSVYVKFSNSPFHEIVEPLTRNIDLPIVHQNRHTVSAPFVLGHERAQRLQSDRSLRVLVYCTNDFDLPNPDVAFPSQIELKVNAEIFQGNLRGIKKKPGTTRPADITHLIRKMPPHFQNNVSITYAATDKKFTYVVNLVRKHSVESLASKIKQGNVIPRLAVLNEMRTNANDADVVATSIVMSLKCPLSAMRINLPCRSTICTHNQCFDASSFLQLQEQAPQWSCPICNKVFTFEDLAVDQYVQDILQWFPNSTDQVTIEPDGTVKSGDIASNTSASDLAGPSERMAGPDGDDGDDDDDDDIIEIRNERLNGVDNGATYLGNPHSYVPSATSQSRQPSTGTSVAPSPSSTKRKQTEVIDLTLSSDDDDGEPPRRPVKRQSTGGFNSSFNSSLPMLGHRPPSNPPAPPPPSNGPAFAMPLAPRSLVQATPVSPSWGSPSYGAFTQYNAPHNTWGSPR